MPDAAIVRGFVTRKQGWVVLGLVAAAFLAGVMMELRSCDSSPVLLDLHGKHDQLHNSMDSLSTYIDALKGEVDKLRQDLVLTAPGGAGRTKTSRKVALFTIMFGEKTVNEPWLPLFIKSAEVSGVDYFILCDPPLPIKLPPNIHQIHISYDALVDLISSKLFSGKTLDMRFAELYKVIDVKPLLGYLFRDLLANYGFWGHIDNDVIMGNVARFLTNDLLDNFDIISGLRRGDNGLDELNTWGPLTLYRNVPKITELFRHTKDLLHVFDNQSAMFFDEWGGAKREYNEYSISKALNNEAEALGIRWHGGFPLGWDGECLNTQADRCSECVLTSRFYTEGATRSTLTWNRTVIAPNEEHQTYEVILCHFQKGKELLSNLFDKLSTSKRQQLVDANPLYYSYREGFHV